MAYLSNPARYDILECGHCGLQLPAILVGLRQNFGEVDALGNGRARLRTAVAQGIAHFDLVNN